MPITAVIPATNEGISIGSTVIKAKKYADHVIVVDDGSTDDTAEIAKLAGADVIIHSENRGKSEAFKTGIGAASQNGTKIIVAIDMDDKSCADIIQKTIDSVKNSDCDIVVSSWSSNSRNIRKTHILNKKNINTGIRHLTLSVESLSNIDFKRLNGSFIRDMLYQAEENNLRIKYLNFEKEHNLDQFNGRNIGVVVPAYNEEQLIKETIDNVPKYIKKIYVIDDGSKDKTSEIVKSLKNPRVCLVRHENNKGVGASIITGYKLALEDNMDIVAVMAGDNQMDPEQLPKLLIPIIDGRADYTKGNRLISKEFRRGMSKWRSFGNIILTMITKIGSGYWNIVDPQNGYTAISRKALETIDLDSVYTYYGYCNDMLIKLNTFGMIVEDITMPSRYGNERSKIKYRKYIIKVAPMIFRGFLWRLKTKYMILDFHPLVFFYLASMVLLPSGILLGLWVFYQKLYHNATSPNFPLLTVFLTLAGLQLLLFAMFFDMQVEKENSRHTDTMRQSI
jgi:glycosyltransferase involved in cell wall biosynthesis